MPENIDAILDRIFRDHVAEPRQPDDPDPGIAFLGRTGFELPLDMCRFYARFASAWIHEEYQILPLNELVPTGLAIYQDEEWRDAEPEGWFVFARLANGDYVGVDLVAGAGDARRVFECDRENVRQRRVVAASFMEFLQRALDDSVEGVYFIDGEIDSSAGTIDVPYRPTAGWLRRTYGQWSEFPEIGPETCASGKCEKLRIDHSIHCRRHHFEAILKLPYPFSEESEH